MTPKPPSLWLQFLQKLGLQPIVETPATPALPVRPRPLRMKLAETLDYQRPDPANSLLDPQGFTHTYNGVFLLIVINLVLFGLDHLLGQGWVQSLYLNLRQPQWFQFITSLFCHANWQHLSGNLFFLYIFGRLVEEEEGAIGVIGSYILCGLGANLMTWLFLGGPAFSLGASGAVFGLFSVSVLIRLSWNWRRILEVLILGQFVIQQVFAELSRAGVQDGINRVAHLGGALFGMVLVLSWMRIRQGSRARA